MKPLKLSLKNFGPYEKAQVDFSQLESPFLITGATGSGKTTLFEAMEFALYGVSRGKTIKETISNFAPKGSLMQVNFCFEHQSKAYEVQRSYKLTQKGDLSYDNKTSYFKRLVDNTTLANKTQNINDEIKRLLNIDATQFRQIVMLQQGEFSAFLKANRNDKEELFRKAFGTNIYQLWTQKVKQRFDEDSQVLKEQQVQLNQLFKQLQFNDSLQEKAAELLTPAEKNKTNIVDILQLLALIEEQTALWQADIAQLNKKKSAQEQERDLAQNQLGKQTSINQRLQNQAALLKEQAALREQAPSMQQKEALLNQLNFAKENQSLWERYHDNSGQAEQAKKQAQLLKEQLAQMEQTSQILAAENQSLANKLPQIKQMQQQLTLLNSKLGEFDHYEQAKLENKHLLDLAKQEQAKYQDTQNKLVELKQVREKLEQKQAALPDEAELLRKKNKQELAQQTLRTSVANFSQQRQALKQVNDLLAQKFPEYQAAKENEQKTLQLWRELEQQYTANISAELAQNLADNTPCPVCGSTTHPHLAQAIPGKISKNDVDQAKQRADQAWKNKNEIEANFLETKQRQTEKSADLALAKDQLKQMGYVSFAQAKEALQLGQETLLSLEESYQANAKQKQVLLDQLALTMGKEDKLTQSLSAMQAKLMQIETKKAQAEAQLAEIAARIPQEFTNKAQLEAKIKQLHQEIASFESEHEAKQKQWQDLQTDIEVAKSKQANLKTLAQNALENAQKSKELLQEALRKNALTWDELAQLYQALDQRQTLLDSLKEYQSHVQTIENQLALLASELKDEHFVNTTELEEKIAAFKAEINQLQGKESNLKALLKQNKQIENQIGTLNEALNDRYQKLGELKQLNDIMSGLGNKTSGSGSRSKVSLERYILREYFKKALRVANPELRKMTNGRYELKMHSLDDNNQGFEIDVLDNYMNETRSSDRLSGGETFEVSLALALAISKVIQAQAGGVEIDALFIDEGFGTLDKEHVEHTVEVLQHLGQAHQMVGVISHLDELKEALNMQLQITPEGNGRSTVAVVAQ